MSLTKGLNLMRTTSALAARYGCRRFTTDSKGYVSVTADPEFDGSVAVVKMQKKPVNSLCSNLYRELRETISDLEKNESVRAMILTSAFPGVFTVGLDLKAVLGAKRDDIHTLMSELIDSTMTWYGSRLITIAAINGHCMAGGALMALTADYRVMAEGSYRIGLNESKMGLHFPSYLTQMMENVLGPKATARALQLSSVYPSEEACRLGWVEEVAPMDQVLTAARRELRQWLEIPDSARAAMKKELRRKEIEDLIARREEDVDNTTSIMASPEFQMQLKATVKAMMKN